MCGFNFDTTYTELPSQFFTMQNADKVISPKIVIVNHELANFLGLHFQELSKSQQAQLFSGNILPKGAKMFSQAYAGHQFGHFTMLGDGRAVVWGEHITKDKMRLDIQFKGSGKTPYSRRGDGKAALGPMLREYIISEAMHYLNIPTTRSLAVAITGEQVMRETPLTGAILTRVASSHIRVGTFEYAAALQDRKLIKAMMDYTINRHFLSKIKKDENRAISLIKIMIESQLNLIVNWMRVGFIHGVMNTDNMALSGETIDFGPCAFMDNYDPNTVFSSIDRHGRYAFANQPKIAQWNLARFVETLLPFIHQDVDKAIKIGEELLNNYTLLYKRKWLEMMKTKIGLFGEYKNDEILINSLLTLMKNEDADYTNTFIKLSEILTDEKKINLVNINGLESWCNRWKERLSKNKEPIAESISMMNINNPQVIPRNHKVEAALLSAEEGNFEQFYALLKILKNPYKVDEKAKIFQKPPTPDEQVHETFCGT